MASWTARRYNQSILKEISLGISLEGMMLRLKLQYFGHLMQRVDSFGKDSDAGRDWGQEEKGTTEDEMAGWHHWLDGCESEWTLGVGDGQGGLACCNSWGRKESDMTERLIWSDLMSIESWRHPGWSYWLISINYRRNVHKVWIPWYKHHQSLFWRMPTL